MTKIKLFILLPLITLLAPQALGGVSHSKIQSKNSTARLISSVQQAQKDSSIEIGVHITLPQGWHTYWKNPGDIGQAPKVRWVLPSKIKKKKLMWPAPQRISYEKWINFGYYNQVALKLPISIPRHYSKKTIPIQAMVEWIICKSVCIPFSQKVNINIPVHKKQKKHRAHAKILSRFTYPEESSWVGQIKKHNGSYKVLLNSQDSVRLIDVFPYGFLPHSAPSVEKISQNSYSLKYKKKDIKKNLEAFSALVVYKKGRQIHSQKISIKPTLQISLILFLLLAFVGGVILNFMPCVLPVVFLKFYNTLSAPKNQLLSSSLAYSLGIILSFLGLALTIQLFKSGSENVGWGFQMQSPLFVTFLIFFFSFISLSFLGLLAIPQIILVRFKNNSHHLFKSLMSGFLASASASPCTAPFMGVAIGYAFAQSMSEIVLVFSALGLGMSSPYLILGVFPQWLKYFPRPGKWNQNLKKAMVIPLFGTILWLVNILSHLDSSWILPIIISLSLLILSFWLKHQSLISKNFFITLFIFSSLFALFPPLLSKTLQNKKSIIASQKTIPFSKLAFHQAIRNKKTFILYFTAEWCITCKVNEWTTLNNPEVINFLQQRNIFTMKGDWTSRDPEISQVLSQYGRISVPFTIFFKDQKEVILPTILTPNILMKTISSQ